MFDWTGTNSSVKVLYSKGSVATQILIDLKNNADKILLDCGDGALRDILDNEINVNHISAIFFSHEHFDHIGGIYSLFGYQWFKKRKKDIDIFYPEGCEAIKQILDLYQDIHEDKLEYLININRVSAGNIFHFKNIKIEPIKSFHPGDIINLDLKIVPGLIYKFDIDGEIIVYSGDTGYFHQIEDVFRNADLAIIESTFETKKESNSMHHLDEEQAESIGKLAKNYILVHKR